MSSSCFITAAEQCASFISSSFVTSAMPSSGQSPTSESQCDMARYVAKVFCCASALRSMSNATCSDCSWRSFSGSVTYVSVFGLYPSTDFSPAGRAALNTSPMGDM